MQAFVKEIGHIIDESEILTVDIFSVSYYRKETTKSFNYGRPAYIHNILPAFLETGSIGLVDRQIDEFREIPHNQYDTQKPGPFQYDHFDDRVKPGHLQTFEGYLEFLSLKKFGKSCVWINNFINDQGIKINVSVLLVLDTVPDKAKVIELKYVVYKTLFTDAFRIITNEFLIVTKEHEWQSERIASEEHFGHTFNNLFPQTIDSVKQVNRGLSKVCIQLLEHTIEIKSLPRIKHIGNWLEETNVILTRAQALLSDAEKDMTITKILFDSLTNQLKYSDDFQCKTIGETVQFLAKNITTRHKIVFDQSCAAEFAKEFSTDVISAIFLLFWNLIHNATKFSGFAVPDDIRTIQVSADCGEDGLKIMVTNWYTKTIKPLTVAYLEKESQSPDPLDDKGKKGGLTIIRTKADKLGWKIKCDQHESIVENATINDLQMTRELYKIKITVITNIRK